MSKENYKEGDIFVSLSSSPKLMGLNLETDEEIRMTVSKGDLVVLIDDDGTEMPLFKSLLGNWKIYLPIGELLKINLEGLE